MLCLTEPIITLFDKNSSKSHKGPTKICNFSLFKKQHLEFGLIGFNYKRMPNGFIKTVYFHSPIGALP